MGCIADADARMRARSVDGARHVCHPINQKLRREFDLARTFEYRLDVYEHLAARKTEILAEAERIGAGLGIPAEIKGRFGISGATSALPAPVRRAIRREIEGRMDEVAPLRHLGDEIRRVVKSVYGDDYDAAPANTCEAALGVAYDALLTPPQIGRGEPYRARVIGLIERHIEHHLSYGRPFPPMHKDMFADRGSTAGELGLLGRRDLNTDCVMVPMVGARNQVHGIKSYSCPLLLETDSGATAHAMTCAAQVHARDLAGFVTLGYDTPGYGRADKTEGGTPVLLAQTGALAASQGVPFICDNAWGIPFIGVDPRRIGADVMLYSMDKVAGAPTSGLLVGREGPMVNVRRALGVHSERFGTTSAHGKAVHVAADPGKMAMLGVLASLRVLRDRPQLVQRPIDDTYAIVIDEYQRMKSALGEGFVITKSFNTGGVEVNYERTWVNGRMGIPIFNNEDRIAGSQLINLCAATMGILVGVADDANVLINPGLGTVDDDGSLIEERMRLAVRGLFATMALLREWVDRGAS